ncbi:hypothetical protein OCB72_17990 [Bacillus cereus]|nr:hypothetical protein [Bacillus cereus]MED3356811.1 hypothetical protein [Bacillus thuringiensis]
MDFEKQAMQARLDLAERQINKRLKEIDKIKADGYEYQVNVEEIGLYLLLATITGKENKYIEF